MTVERSVESKCDVGPDFNKRKSNHSDILWVPADKHPEIAPKEFERFIKGHTSSTPLKRTSSLCRVQSALSELYVSEDEEELVRTLSEKKRSFLKRMKDEKSNPKDVMERNSLLFDESKSSVFKSKSERSLLRRSAFSARGYSRKSITEKHDKVKQDLRDRAKSSEFKNTEDNAEAWDKNNGIRLYDPPVDFTEWLVFESSNSTAEVNTRAGPKPRLNDTASTTDSTKPDIIAISNLSNDEKQISWMTGLLQERLKSVRMMANTAQGLIGLTSFLTSKFKNDKSGFSSKLIRGSDRLPLYTERNIYRMSHMKLTDPNRNLHDQVLIYNFMYWYLSVQTPSSSSIYIEKKKKPSFINLARNMAK